MIILFGSKGKQDFKGAYWGKCSNCKKKGAISVFEMSRWFTLFFIPLIPFSTKYYLKCNSCYREWFAEDEEKDMVKEKLDNGDVLEGDEFKERYKKQLAKKEKEAQEFRDNFMKFVAAEAKKKK